MIFTIPTLLAGTAARLEGKRALSEAGHGITYGELRRTSLLLADRLREAGVAPGTRVGVCMAKGIEQVIAILGIMHSDAIFVPVLQKLKRHNISHIIGDCGMSLLITDSTRFHEIAELEGKTRFAVIRSRFTKSTPDRVEIFDVTEGEAESRFRSIGSDTAAIIYSSGSTGLPKGIIVTHRNLHDGAHIVSTYLGTTENDRIAGVLDNSFDYGLNQLWQTILKGASLHFINFLLPSQLFKFLETERITMLPLMPFIISRLFDPRTLRPVDPQGLSSVTTITTTGGRVSPKMIGDLTGSFPGARLFLMYGLTEAFRSTFLPPEQVTLRPTSIGRAIPDVEIIVIGEDGQRCPPGKPGELVHRGGCITKGYWNNPEATAQRFRQHPDYPGETLVYSGDQVVADEEGFLFFVGRKDSMIKCRGIRISPHEIELVAEHYPGVAGVVAFGFLRADAEEEVVLAYCGVENLSEAGFLAYLQEELPPHMMPHHLCRLPSFGSTGNEGKIDRQGVIAAAKAMLAANGLHAWDPGTGAP